jgi:hypothetical protein
MEFNCLSISCATVQFRLIKMCSNEDRSEAYRHTFVLLFIVGLEYVMYRYEENQGRAELKVISQHVVCADVC